MNEISYFDQQKGRYQLNILYQSIVQVQRVLRRHTHVFLRKELGCSQKYNQSEDFVSRVLIQERWYNYYIACWNKVMERRQDKNKNSAKRTEDIKYCRAIKDFLETFKTTKCTLENEHRLEICHFYHSAADRRRNPYNNGTFLYYLDSKCHCQNPKCASYHSNYEYSYHPLIYKKINCTRNSCQSAALHCWMIHKGEYSYFQQGEFFRFDIATFKTIKCARTDIHERKTCLGFHNEKDRRRPDFNTYTHIPCTKSNCNCQRSHNKIEQLYHPTRYKTKFCQYFNKDATACEYHDFCSFAHTKDEILIPLIDPDNKDPNYIISIYKTVWCPYTQDHDRGECPYAHNIQDYRRKPSQYKYKPEKCPNWDFSNKIESIQLSKCPAGMNCNMCHGWMEHRYHPLIYKSKGVAKNFVKKDEYLEKKLNNQKEGTQKKDKQSNIEAIVNKEIESNKASIFTVGAPFFKHEREQERQVSEGSKQTKPKTGNQSNIGSQRSFNSGRKGSVMEQPKNKKVISSMFFHFDEHRIWECDSIQNSKSRNSDGRSRSQGTSNEPQVPYSRSIKEFINNNSIIEKLQREKVNEISLIHMTDKKINDMEVLTRDEKEILLRNLKKYSLKSCLKTIEYSRNLSYFFSINNAEQLLNKLQQRFVKESCLLKLTKQAIKELAFLDEQEKEVLPKLLRSYQKFSEAKQFQTLLYDVNNWVKIRNQAVQQN